MGMFDVVCGIQVKCTPDRILKNYKIGDFIQLEDGIYIGYEGWFSVRNSEVTDCGRDVYDKWGNRLSLEELINNPILIEVTKSMEKKTKKKVKQNGNSNR